MSYRVVWTRTVRLQQLPEIWLNASDRNAVTRACNEIDWKLSVHPTAVGESRNLGERFAFIRPLALTFTVDEARRLVRITRIVYAP